MIKISRVVEKLLVIILMLFTYMFFDYILQRTGEKNYYCGD